MSTVYMSRHAPYGGRAERRGTAGPLGIAGLCLVGLALTWAVAALVPAAQFKDAVALHDFTLLDSTHAGPLAKAVLVLLNPDLFVAWTVVLAGIAILRRRWDLALAVVAVLALAPLTAEALKPLLAHPHAPVGGVFVQPASWPSGHSAAALALVLCAVLVAPPRWRTAVAALGAGFAVAVGCSLLILAWHMPSDVFGGYLVAALWMALAVAALRTHRRLNAPRGAERPSGA